MEDILLYARVIAYPVLAITLFWLAKKVDDIAGNGAKRVLVDLLWSYGFIWMTLCIMGILKAGGFKLFDTSDFIMIPITYSGIICYRTLAWLRKGHDDHASG